MVDGFHWTRVTSKQLRFLYETVTLTPVPEQMHALAAKVDRKLAPADSVGFSTTATISAGHTDTTEAGALTSQEPTDEPTFVRCGTTVSAPRSPIKRRTP